MQYTKANSIYHTFMQCITAPRGNRLQLQHLVTDIKVKILKYVFAREGLVGKLLYLCGCICFKLLLHFIREEMMMHTLY